MGPSPTSQMIVNQVGDAEQAAEIVDALTEQYGLGVTFTVDKQIVSTAPDTPQTTIILNANEIQEILGVVAANFGIQGQDEVADMLNTLEGEVVRAVLDAAAAPVVDGEVDDISHATPLAAVYDIINLMLGNDWQVDRVTMDTSGKITTTPAKDDVWYLFENAQDAWHWTLEDRKDHPGVVSYKLTAVDGYRNYKAHLDLPVRATEETDAWNLR